jgi:ubiquinone/menaquinone biosynthesis C-methylase UbiE
MVDDNLPNISYSYEPFSQEPEYIEVNRLLVQSLGLHCDMRVLDIACGTGSLSELILDEFALKSDTANLEPRGIILGLDISQESLRLAHEHITARNPQPDSIFMEASADCLPIRTGSIDTALMGNAIHIFSDKDLLLREVHRVLLRGGLFAFNSSFYAGTFVPGTERLYIEWVKEALAYIRRKDQELRCSGLEGIARRRGLVEPAFSRRWLSASEYGQLLDRNGFDVQRVEERSVMLSQHSFEMVGAYAGLAAVLLSGYPLRIAAEALVRSAGPALGAAGMEHVPRYWLEVVAVKR